MSGKEFPFKSRISLNCFSSDSTCCTTELIAQNLWVITGIFLGDDDIYTFASYLIRIRFLNNLTSPVYTNLAMNAPYFRATQILPELQQQCGQANVNGTKLRNMLIPLPPLAEQRRIVAKVDNLMTLCDQLEAQLTSARTDTSRLLEAVLDQTLTATVPVSGPEPIENFM